MKQHYIVFSLFTLLIFNSCGIITKARYGNGLKLNLEFKGDHEKKLTEKTFKVKKSGHLNQDTSINLTLKESSYSIDSIDIHINNSSVLKEATISHQLLEINKINSHDHKNKNWNKTKSVFNQVQSVEKSKAPIEPNSKAAGYLFYGSILTSIILSVLGIAIPVISVILFLAWLLGLILAFVGLKKIKQSGDKFRGYGLDLSIIILAILSIILTIGAIALAVALL